MTWLPKATAASNKSGTIPAPVGGLNASAALADMNPTDAISMRNWWPGPYGCAVRNGTRQWSTGLGYPVNTLVTWSSIAGETKCFAFSGSSMYDITVRGPINVPLLTGLTNSWWQDTQQVNPAGAHLILLNGQDDGILYNETGLHRLVAGDGTTAYTWKNIDPAQAIEATVHEVRLWAVQKDTAVGWYLPVGAIFGVFEMFDFGPLFSKGGYLAQLTTWTVDDGNGAEDHLVAVSSEGEAVVYGGSDPSDITTWSLVGVYNVGAPVSGRRSYAKVGGDLVFLTQRGLISTAAMLVSTKVKDTPTVKMSKVQYLVSQATNDRGFLEGWSFKYFPNINMLLINVPTTVETSNIQIVANDVVDSQPWTIFDGMPAQCWKLFDSAILFGDSKGNVWEAWTGYSDEALFDGTGGNAITSTVQQAYSYLDAGPRQKQVDMFRTNFITDDSNGIDYAALIDYDFSLSNVRVPNAPFAGVPDSLWNIGLWNSAIWQSGDTTQRNEWLQSYGMGYVVSIALAMQSTSSVIWLSTDFSYKTGGLL